MAETTDTEPDLDYEVVQETDEFPFVPENDQKLRCFILRSYADNACEVDRQHILETMECIFKWIKDGTVPKSRGAKLHAVAGGKSE